METLINKIKQKYNNNRKLLLFCIVVTFIIGLITHAYMFFQDSFSHDSLNELDAGAFGNEWKIQLGRFVVPIYRMLTRGNITIPWLIGVVSLFWIALSVFFVVKIFDIKKNYQIFFTAGIMVSNITVISNTATYINDLDSNMFALFLSVCAVFVWKKYRYGFLFSIPFITLSLGLYQSYVSVTIVLIIMYLVLELLQEKKFREVFLNGIKSIIALSLGGGLYFVLFKAVLYITGIPQAEDTYNSMDQLGTGSLTEFIGTIIYTFNSTVYSLFIPKNAVSKNLLIVLIGLLFLFCAGIVILKLLDKKIGWLEKTLALVLIGTMPIGMGLTEILSNGQKHDLTCFANWFIFVFSLLVIDRTFNNSHKKNNVLKSIFTSVGKVISIVTVVLILLGNIVSANEIYLKKELEQDSNLVFFSRVVERMDTFEEYDRKTTPVVFVGRPDYFDENKAGFKNGYEITGATGNYVLGFPAPSYYERYFDYKLNYDIITINNNTLNDYTENELVKKMPSFPQEGCMQILDDILVVKLGELK